MARKGAGAACPGVQALRGRETRETKSMPQRIRKLIGTVLLLLLVVFWALSAMAFAQGRVTELGWFLQMICYTLLGAFWIVPAGLLIRWMERPDRKI